MTYLRKIGQLVLKAVLREFKSNTQNLTYGDIRAQHDVPNA